MAKTITPKEAVTTVTAFRIPDRAQYLCNAPADTHAGVFILRKTERRYYEKEKEAHHGNNGGAGRAAIVFAVRYSGIGGGKCRITQYDKLF